MERLKERYNMRKEISPQVTQGLMTYPFAGNVRELSNIVEQAFLISRGETIQMDDLPPQVRGDVSVAPAAEEVVEEGGSYADTINLVEYRLLKAAVEKYGSTHKAARELGISQSTVVRKLKRLSLKGSES
jgi:transcriptional regulator with PAS, ATPase and Fis domain